MTNPERPELVDQYRKLCSEITKLTAQKEKLKPKVKKLIEESGGWPDCYLQQSKKRDYFDQPLLEWIKREYPDLVDKLIIETIDWKEFTACLNRRKVDIMKMPDECSNETILHSLITQRRKKDETEE